MIRNLAIVRVVALGAFGAAAGAATLSILFALRSTILMTFDTDPPRLVAGLYPAERDPDSGLTFAWTGSDMTIRLPGLDRRRPWMMDIRARSGRAEPASPVLSFYADGLLVSTHQSTPGFETIRIVVPPRPQRPRGVVVRMDVSSTIVPGPGDARALGIMVDEVNIAPDGIVMPPASTVGAAALGGGALGAATALIAAPAGAAAAALIICFGQAAMLSRGFAPYTDYPMSAAWLAASVALAIAFIAAWLSRRGASPSSAARFVVGFSGAALFLKLLVLLHPEMPVGDAMFHAHKFQGVLAGNLYFTSIAPGNYTFPYPPGFYLFAAAFAGLVRRGAADMNLLRVVALAVDAVAGAMLYVAVKAVTAVKADREDAWPAVAAVVIYQMIPLEFRIFTVGNLTNAFAQSVSVFALVLMATRPPVRVRSAGTALLTLAITLAFLSHTSTFALLFVTCVLIAALFRWRGSDRVRNASPAVLVATLMALVLAIGLYYAHFGETYRAEFARIGTETAAAAPDAGGRTLAARAEIVPTYLRQYLGASALLLALLGGWQLYRTGARDALALTIAGWALSCTVFLAIGILTPVDMRYYLASVPAVAISSALGAAWLWRTGVAGRIVAGTLAAAVCWGGVVTWYGTF